VKPEPLKILLVDDIPENLVALAALLRQPGVELISARSGTEALELVLVHELALALIDVQMPEMDGFELAELMRGSERSKHVPIIFVTAGSRDPQRVFKGYESGAVDFLYKPIDSVILTSKVNVFLQLARQRRELAQALQLNDLFVGILGHDLRNPLGALVSGIELLAMQSTEPEHRRVLERMSGSADRMTAMINELLDLTRVRFAPGLGLARTTERVDLREVLQRTVEELRTSHRGREIVVEGASRPTTGDPERLLQLFSNLIGNALVHGSAGTVRVRILDDAPPAAVEIHNPGVIPREVLSTLFEPFKRQRNRNGGLGLGLYIAHQIAQAHGGDISVASSEAGGTCFTVTLPGST
jgi:two-component system, sensor histidine kinase and response regulator